MKKLVLSIVCIGLISSLFGQNVMTPELLWKLGRVGAIGITDDNKSVVYSVRHYDATENTSSAKTYIVSMDGGDAEVVHGDVHPLPFFAILAQLSRSVTVRLKTGAPGLESTVSAQK